MLAPYVYVPYPKWIFHPDQDPRLVQTASEHAAAGPGWHEGEVGPDGVTPRGAVVKAPKTPKGKTIRVADLAIGAE